MLSQRELRRLHIINKAIEGSLAGFLKLSDRQVRRLISRVRESGSVGIVHKSRGRPSNRRTDKKVKEKVMRLYQSKFKGFGPRLAAEKFCELEGIKVSDETLRIWLMESGDWKRVRKVKRHREWRERKAHFGEMVQLDGSHHDWFDCGEKSVLMGYIERLLHSSKK